MAYLKGIVELNVPAPCMRLLGPTETAIPPFSKLIAAGLPLSTLAWTPTMLLAPFARTAKLVLERIELFVMDAILAVPAR